MIELEHTPLVLVVSAPSGAGKTTLCEQLLQREPSIRYSISCTTRAPRSGEVDGRDYQFLDDERFNALVEQGAFLEHAVVHGHQYGTRDESVRAFLAAGQHVLMDVDVQGAQQLRESITRLDEDDPLRRGYLDAFIAPPSLDILEQRLRARGKDDDAVIALRMKNAAEELACQPEYDYLVVNDVLEDAIADLQSIFRAECLRVRNDR